MGPVGVVTLLLEEQLGSEFQEGIWRVNQLVELLFMGALGPLDAAV